MQDLVHTDVAIIGAGPIGIEVAIELRKADFDVVQFDRGQIGQTIFDFPIHTRFFSSPERIAIGDIPIQSIDQTKATREEYLAHLRTVVKHYELDIRTFEEVIHIAPKPEGGFILSTRTVAGTTHQTRAQHIVLATGGTARYRQLGIGGEDLQHVSHHLEDPHRYFERRVLVVGGKNSAVEAALRCYHAGAHVAISYRGSSFPDRVKYWLKPEIEGLIHEGTIEGEFRTKPIEITPTHVTLQHLDTGETTYVPADFVLLMIGYEADMSLFEMLKIPLEGNQYRPIYNTDTMETGVKGVYVAGTAMAGTQGRFTVYLENCHIHAKRIAAALTGTSPPKQRMRYELPES